MFSKLASTICASTSMSVASLTQARVGKLILCIVTKWHTLFVETSHTACPLCAMRTHNSCHSKQCRGAGKPHSKQQKSWRPEKLRIPMMTIRSGSLGFAAVAGTDVMHCPMVNMCSFLRREHPSEIRAMFQRPASYIIETTIPTQRRLCSGLIKHVANADKKLTYLYRECY